MFLLNLIKEKKYPKLWELDVSVNELDDLCIKEMTKMLRTQANVSSLHSVSFEGNGFSEALLQEFNSVLLSSYNCSVCSFISCLRAPSRSSRPDVTTRSIYTRTWKAKREMEAFRRTRSCR